MEPWLKKTVGHAKGFTLVELLIALVITGIILSAVTTLAFAMSSASRISDDAVYTQTQLRTAATHILDLVRYSRLVCASFGGNLVIWRADDNRNDRIDVNEVVYLEYDGLDHTLTLCAFVLDGEDNIDVLTALGLPAQANVLSELAKSQTKTALIEKYATADPPAVRRGVLLRGCSELMFTLDKNPPWTRCVTFSFILDENGVDRRYEIVAAMRVSAAHLLSGDGTTVVGDDD